MAEKDEEKISDESAGNGKETPNGGNNPAKTKEV